MRLDQQTTAEEIEPSVRVAAREVFGPERAAELDFRMASFAHMLARIAREPVDFAGDPPDSSGIEEDADRG